MRRVAAEYVYPREALIWIISENKAPWWFLHNVGRNFSWLLQPRSPNGQFARKPR
jgi:hypothetical protein